MNKKVKAFVYVYNLDCEKINEKKKSNKTHHKFKFILQVKIAIYFDFFY